MRRVPAAVLLVEGRVELVVVEGKHVGLDSNLEAMISLVTGQRHSHPLCLAVMGLDLVGTHTVREKLAGNTGPVEEYRYPDMSQSLAMG